MRPSSGSLVRVTILSVPAAAAAAAAAMIMRIERDRFRVPKTERWRVFFLDQPPIQEIIIECMLQCASVRVSGSDSSVKSVVCGACYPSVFMCFCCCY